MADADIRVTTEKIGSACTACENGLETLKSSLASLHASIDELNETWEGSNHDNFCKQFNVDYEAMDRMNKMLASFVDILRLAQQKYESCEAGEVHDWVAAIPSLN